MNWVAFYKDIARRLIMSWSNFISQLPSITRMESSFMARLQKDFSGCDLSCPSSSGRIGPLFNRTGRTRSKGSTNRQGTTDYLTSSVWSRRWRIFSDVPVALDLPWRLYSDNTASAWAGRTRYSSKTLWSGWNLSGTVHGFLQYSRRTVFTGKGQGGWHLGRARILRVHRNYGNQLLLSSSKTQSLVNRVYLKKKTLILSFLNFVRNRSWNFYFISINNNDTF